MIVFNNRAERWNMLQTGSRSLLISPDAGGNDGIQWFGCWKYGAETVSAHFNVVGNLSGILNLKRHLVPQ